MPQLSMMKTLNLILLAAVATLACAHAQVTPPFQPKEEGQPEKPERASNEKGFWQAKVNGGEYAVAVEHITSVSRHSYVLDGTVLVDEVTIDTSGQALARFYYLSPLSAKTHAPGSAGEAAERGKEILASEGKREGVDLDTMVFKKYPDTTHAKSIEYRIGSESELAKLYKSAMKAWQSGDGGQYTPPVPSAPTAK